MSVHEFSICLKFLEITEAYEALQEYSANGRKDNGGLSKQYNEMDFITKTEEQYYRQEK